ncbi:hypothetical protein [Nostoc sp. C052]|uniref:hypothetical protein n=1 Tax=Nostoc sp. C052 TaxID=2576902 RepID=UPI001C4A84C3|nr:hypothetical protein [Nostoc sp. C052]
MSLVYLTLNPSPYKGYGVHTSLKIPPSTWFRHLAIDCAIAPKACHCKRECVS